MQLRDDLRPLRLGGHDDGMTDEEATRLTLETLFVLRAKIDEIHAVVVGGDEDEEEEDEEDS